MNRFELLRSAGLVVGLTVLAGCPAPPTVDSTTPPPITTAAPARQGPDRNGLPKPAAADDWALPTVAT
ncbi:MAG: hypothetical protein RIF41_09285, partial [Polyangiaceae bacterium]